MADVGAGLSRLTDATLEATLQAVMRSVQEQRGLAERPTRIAIVAMGRYGGFELSYGSDADVLFVHQPEPGADPQAATSYAQAVANEIRRLLALPGGDPALEVDAGLRPEGKQGALVRSLESYAAYYAKWSMVWEAQALLRADAVVGDPDLRAAFVELIDPLRFPADGLSEDDVLEVRRIKARVDQERLPRGADPQLHLKLGRGGLADIEWTVQLLQMRHAGEVPQLRTVQTLAALEAAREADLISAEDCELLSRGWRMVSRMRNAVTLARGSPPTTCPGRPASEPRWPASWATRRAPPTSPSTTTCARRGCRARSSTGSSGARAPARSRGAPGGARGDSGPGRGRSPPGDRNLARTTRPAHHRPNERPAPEMRAVGPCRGRTRPCKGLVPEPGRRQTP